MAIFKIIRVGADGSESELDSGFGAVDWARIGRGQRFHDELGSRLETIRAGGLEHELAISTRRKPDVIKLIEDCRCKRECAGVEAITAFEVRAS